MQDPTCVARGKAWKSPCKSCPKGMTEEEEIQLTVDVQAGMATGDQVKFEQIADEAVGHIAGDLIFTIKQIPHPFLERDGNNLKMNLDISLLDSLVGFRKTFQHVDGHEVVVEKREVSHCTQLLVVPGEGMPIKGRRGMRGDLHVTLHIHFPQAFSNTQKDLFRKALA